MKKILLSLAVLLCCTIGFAQNKQVSMKLDPAKSQWFKDVKFGMFLHWGLYSVLEGSYDGHTLPDTTLPHGKSWYAEWIEKRLEVPQDVYEGLVSQFNPVHYDADAWVKEAYDAGMRYLIITSKHHDGFALWDSKVDGFNITKTPYKKDLLKPLADACKKYGVKLGFYYSHWLDWNHRYGALPEWEPKRPDAEFEKYWQSKALPQVKELIQRYDPDLLWFDCWDSNSQINERRRDELIRLIRTYSDKCLINGRISSYNPGENVDFIEMGDNGYPAEEQTMYWETPATMQHSWGYHAKDYNWKSADEMLRLLVNNVSKGGNYVLNIGPKADGTFPAPAIRRLREMGAWMSVNGEAIYGTQKVSFKAPEGIFLTQKNGNLYIFLTKPVEKFTLPAVVKGTCEVLEDGRPIEYVTEDGSSTFTVPADQFRDSSIQVLKVKI